MAYVLLLLYSGFYNPGIWFEEYMKNKSNIIKAIKFTLTALVISLLFSSCFKEHDDITEPDGEQIIESVEDLQVPEGFDWKTQQTVQVFVQLPQNGELKPLIITNRDRTKRYFKGFPENSSSPTVSSKITIPAYVNELRLIYDGATGPNMAYILNETLMYDFNANKKSAKSVGCDLTGYVTYSKGGWGQKPNGNNVGALRDQYFDQVYSGDFVVGDDNGYTITFEESDDVKNYLPGGGGPEVLSESHLNPVKKDKLGNLADQIIAARLNRDYSAAGFLGDSEAQYHLGELVYNDGPFEDMTVDDFLELAQTALSGEGLNGYTVEEFKNAAENIINSFHEGNNANILTCPNDDDDGDGDDDDEGEDDNPFIEISSACADGDVIFTIENNGEDDMENSFNYSVTKNGTEIETGSYELDENETLDVVVSGYNTDVFEITVATPRNETLIEDITGCGDDEDDGGGGDDDDDIDETFQGTLAYEDLWPGKGDYDFNDLVIDYDFEITKNQEIVKDITVTFTVKAFGASMHNGFGFTLPTVTPGDIASVSGYNVENTTVFSLAANGTELGQSYATFIAFDDVRRIMPQTTGGIGVNTQLEYAYTEFVDITLQIDFVDGAIAYDDLNIGTFNPFIIVNTVIDGTPGDRGLEVHLPDYEPSDLFDESYFGQFEDASDPGSGKYFVTDNNLPWAINIAEGFDWVIEFQDITGAYNNFAEWAQSGGINYPDWYLDETGYRNDNLIYPTQINP